MGWEEGTSKHSSSQAHVGQWELPPKSWLEGTQRFRERKSSIQHIQICPRHRREGWARQKASCLAGRWRESSLSFQRCGSAGLQRCGSAGLQAGWLEYRVLKLTERGKKDREDHCREERPVAALMLLSTVGYHLYSPPM